MTYFGSSGLHPPNYSSSSYYYKLRNIACVIRAVVFELLKTVSFNHYYLHHHHDRQSLTVAGEPFVEIYLSGKDHQLFEVKVHHSDFGEFWLQVLLLLFRRRLLSIGLRLRLPVRQRNREEGTS